MKVKTECIANILFRAYYTFITKNITYENIVYLNCTYIFLEKNMNL